MRINKLYVSFFIVIMSIIISACVYKSGIKNKSDVSTKQPANNDLKANINLLFGTKWELVELNGKIIYKDSGKQPFLKFESIDNKAFGNGGCNSFSLRYYIMDSDSIKFLDILSTKMACDNLMYEQEFFEVLSGVGHIIISKDTLQLSDNFKVLAKFKQGTGLK